MNPTYEEIEAKIALLEVQLKLSEAAERAWESSMMQACGEDGPKSVADKFAELESKLETALRECRSAGITIDNLEAKCAALAAELSAVDKIHNEAVFITDDHYEQCPPEVQRMIRSLAVLQIPAYDAFLAEVRAQGVEMAACALDDVNQFNYANMLDDLAQKLRKGAEQ